MVTRTWAGPKQDLKILISELVLRFYDPTKKVTIYTTGCPIYWGRCLPPPGPWPVSLFLTSITSNWADRKVVTSSHICCRTISALPLSKRRWSREWSQTTGNHNPQATAECFPRIQLMLPRLLRYKVSLHFVPNGHQGVHCWYTIPGTPAILTSSWRQPNWGNRAENRQSGFLPSNFQWQNEPSETRNSCRRFPADGEKPH